MVPCGQDLRCLRVQRHWIAVRDVTNIAKGRNSYADPLDGNDLGDGIEDIEEQSTAVLYGAVVAISPMICLVFEKLLKKISIYGVNFDSIEAGLLGVLRGLSIISYQLRNFARFKRMEGLVRLAFEVIGEGVGRRWNCGRRNRKRAILSTHHYDRAMVCRS